MPLDPGQRAAYEATDYVIWEDHCPVLRIGRHCPEMDELFEADGATTAAFVTADNPYGLQRDDGENAEAFIKLLNLPTPYKTYVGEGCDPNGEWPPEASILFVGISRADAESLGREFGQLAIVFVEKGAAPELVVL